MMNVSNKRLESIIGVVALTAVLVGIMVWVLMPNRPTQTNTVRVAETVVPPMHFSQLDGLPVSSTADIMPYVVGVMIDHHPEARPQVGFAEARVVYEAPVEGGLTRYMLVFNSKQAVEKIGPVRSARPYFMDFLVEYGNAVYVHVGGSPLALELLKSSSPLRDLNEFYNYQYFWRATDRSAPHNVYTKSDHWNSYITARGIEPASWVGWNFGELLNVSSSPVTGIAIPFNSSYTVNWAYNASSARYTRSINGKLEKDENGVQLAADTVLVQFVDMKIVDEEGRKDIITTGEGKARVLRDGRIIAGTWKKNGPRTRFYDVQDTEIPLKPGQTWVEIVPNGVSIEVTNE